MQVLSADSFHFLTKLVSKGLNNNDCVIISGRFLHYARVIVNVPVDVLRERVSMCMHAYVFVRE